MSVGWRVLDPSSQDRTRCVRELVNRTLFRSAVHVFQDLKQPPALALVTFGTQNAFPLEIHVVNQGIASLWSFRQARKLLLYVGSFGRPRFGEHFRQSAFQAGQKKFRL